MRVRLLPEAPSYARSSAERALSCDGRGRWFDSSRAYHFADVAQTEEHRGATPGRPVRSGSSASQARGVTGARRAPTSSVRVRDLAGLLQQRSSRAGAARLSPWRGCGSTPRIRSHVTTATPAAGRNGSGYRLLIDRSRVRVPPGAPRAPVAQLAEQFRAVQPRPQQYHSTPSTPPRAGEDPVISHPGAAGGREPPSGERRVSTSGLHHHDRGAARNPAAGRSRTVTG